MLIGEVAARSGLSARMLRHYDRIGLVVPSGRTDGGYRTYAPDDLARLLHVEALRSLGLGLSEVAEVLGDLSFDPTSTVDRLAERTRERIQQETELLRRLERLRASGPGAWSDALRTVALLRGLRDGDPSARQRLVLSTGAGAAGGDAAVLAEAVLAEADPNVSGALQWALARAGDDAVPALVAALGSPARARRRRAVEALDKLGTPAARAALADATGHGDPVVAARAALARGRLGHADAVPALVALVVGGRDDVEAAAVLGALGAAGAAEDVVGALAGVLGDVDAAARRRVAAALAEVPGDPADRVLTRLGDDVDDGVRATAAFVLAGRGRAP